MGFLETPRFPTGISYGSGGGPGFDTRVIETDSGHTQKIRRRSQARRVFNVVEGDVTLDDLKEIRNFYLAIGGVANGFRFKDFTDFSSASDDTGVSASTDQPCSPATGDGSNKSFQMIKVYSAGAMSHTRTITKPVEGTTAVSSDAVDLLGVGFTVNSATGIITFTTAPTAGKVIKWGGLFDVPVSFGESVDRQLEIAIRFFDGGDIPDIPLEEELLSDPVSDQEWSGGSKNFGVISASMTVTKSQARLIVVAPDTAGLQVKLPLTTSIPGGGPHFAVSNTGTESIDVAANDGTSIISVPIGGLVELWLSVNSVGTKTWIGK